MKDAGRILFWTFWGEEWEALSDMKRRASGNNQNLEIIV